MADQEKKEPPVTVDDVVEILAKNASSNDPDENEKLSRFNQQVADARAKASESSSSKARQ